MSATLLRVSELVAGYNGGRVLDGVSFSVDAGETVAVLGRNGVGKTTLLQSVIGMLRPSAGSIEFDGTEVRGRPSSAIARAGVAIVPQGRRIFAPLTVEENLRIARRKGEWSLEEIYALMPRLRERRGNLGSQLSGGEQQMLSIGRALLSSPRLLLLDEPSDGLAPAVVEQIAGIIRDLSERGLAMIIVEQDLRLAFDVAQRVLVMSRGQIVHRDSVAGFRADGARARALLGLG